MDKKQNIPEHTQVRDFRRVLRKFERALTLQNTSSCCCGVTLAQCHVLLEINEKKELTVNQLAENLKLDKSTISRTVDSLYKTGAVERIIPEENRRITRVSLTNKGSSICQSINAGNDDYFTQALGAIPSDKLKTFLEAFIILSDKMQGMNNNKSQ